MKSGKRRVVVTGVGVVSPLGMTSQETWKNILEGKSGISKITRFDASTYDSQIAGEVKNFQPDLWVHKKEQKKMDLFIQYAMAAGKMALDDSGFTITDENADRVGTIVSAGMGGLPGIEVQHNILRDRGANRVSPFFIPMVIPNLAAGQLAITYGARGPNICITTACSTGAHSIGEAMRYIRDGICDVALAGGAESTICPLAIAGFSSMRALSTRNDDPTKASRPWDNARDGFVLAEGSGIMVVEDLEHALKRGARIYCEVVGYGLNCDAYHMTSPSEGGLGAAKCMEMALKDAELNPSDIDYINAHGTSTGPGDIAETQAVKRAFGEHAKKVWVSSTKSMTGHLLGAAGSLEAVFAVLALRDNVVPPTINLDNPSPECDLDYVPNTAREKRLTAVLSNSFGFGGTNASLIFKRGP
ncbi:MAG: beta-ketoacyl-ACP synthase II [Oligoflexia bacterium]|nr:beta-ketoacyl-ACP synthase II [Oligoflexia bacterium]